MRKIMPMLTAITFLVSCTQSSIGWVSAGVGPLSTNAQVSYYYAGALVKQEAIAAGAGSSHDFRGPVGTQLCIQILTNQRTIAYKVPIETTVLMAIVISESNEQFKTAGNARFTVASSCP